MKPTIAARTVAGPAVSVGGIAYSMTAKNTNASATDFRLWLTPSVPVKATVKRLAAKVSRTRFNRDKIPAGLSSGKLRIESIAENKSSPPVAEMTTKRALLFQLRFCIVT